MRHRPCPAIVTPSAIACRGQVVTYSVRTLLKAAAATPIDWQTINGERITLDTMADTREKRDAVSRLRYANAQNIQQAITGIEVAFASPLVYDEHGFPKRNPNYQPPKAKR